MLGFTWKPSIISYLRSKYCWALPIASWALVVGLSLHSSIQDIHRHSMEIATEGARSIFRMVEMTRLWNARHGGIYAPVSKRVTPNPYLDIPNRDIETTDGLRLTMVNPAYMTRQIAEIAERHGILFHITSNKPLRPANAPAPWERESLLRFEQGEEEFRQLVDSANPPTFRYMAPLKVKQACLKCHEKQGYGLGDIRGGISISLPAEVIFGEDTQRIHAVIVKHLMVFTLFSMVGLLFLRQIRRQWLELELTRSHQATIIEERTAHLQESNLRLQEENAQRRKAEEKYRSVSQAAYDAIISVDQEGNISSWNSGAERIFGHSTQQILNKPVTLLMPEDAYESHRRAFSHAVSSGELHSLGQTIEVRALHKNGSEFPVELSLGSWVIDGHRHFTAVMRDITERKQSEQTQRLAATVFGNTAEGLIIADRDGRIVAVNPAFTATTGYSEEDVLGKSPKVLSSGRQDANFYARMWGSLNEEGHWQGEIWNRRKSGEIYPEWLSISTVRDSEGELSHYVGAFSDISELKKSQEQLNFLAYHDPLTNLPNRRLFIERLNHALVQSRRSSKRLAVLFVDLDHFKTVNDSLGHQVGDLLLQFVAQRLATQLREEDTVARLGGDEFTILLENLHESDDTLVVLEKLVAAFKEPFYINRHTLFVTPSIGISLYPDDGEDADILLKGADSAMYKAKEQGRNRYQFYSEELTALAMERLIMETHLRQALHKGQLRVHYQPQIDIVNDTYFGTEALIRWEHPELGLVSPAKFIPLAEEKGMIVEIGEWIMREACLQAVDWRDNGSRFTSVSVNVSLKQFQHPGFVNTVAQVIAETGIEPRHLELEITESFIMQQAENAIAVLGRLKELGVRMAIDDFGTGYSSLSYLKRLPIDTLKIDQSFIRDLPDDSNDTAITQAIIALGRSLNLAVIAEGVETLSQKELLIAEGCNQAQGYYFSPPVPADAIDELAAEYSDAISTGA